MSTAMAPRWVGEGPHTLVPTLHAPRVSRETRSGPQAMAGPVSVPGSRHPPARGARGAGVPREGCRESSAA